MRPIFFREVNSFFSSVIGYVAVGIFLIACWLFLWLIPDNNFLDYGYASLDKFFDIAPPTANAADTCGNDALVCR